MSEGICLPGSPFLFDAVSRLLQTLLHQFLSNSYIRQSDFLFNLLMAGMLLTRYHWYTFWGWVCILYPVSISIIWVSCSEISLDWYILAFWRLSSRACDPCMLSPCLFLGCSVLASVSRHSGSQLCQDDSYVTVPISRTSYVVRIWHF